MKIILITLSLIALLWIGYSKFFAITKTNLLKEKEEIEKQKEEIEQLLYTRSNLSPSQAREIVLQKARVQSQNKLKAISEELEKDIQQNKYELSKNILLDVMQKNIATTIKHPTTRVIKLKTDKLKGRIIGKNGRNLRAIEEATGADVQLEKTDNNVLISSFNPIRREIAFNSIKELLGYEAIHPGVIEDVVEKQKIQLGEKIIAKGQEIINQFNIKNIAPEIIQKLGVLDFRYSFGQNVLNHSIETAKIAKQIATKLGLDSELAFRAGLLHDIGKAIDIETEGNHDELGSKFAKENNESDIVVNAIASHHGAIEETSTIAQIVKIADAVSAARPGARENDINKYNDKIAQLENIPKSFDVVKEAYAIRGGKEIRVFIKPIHSSDVNQVELANLIKEKIEETLKFPGTIKVTVIKENRCTVKAMQQK